MSDRKLEYRIQSLAELPFIVLEHIHWRPQAAKFRDKDKADLRKGQGDDVKTYNLLRRAWAREETWINASLVALVMGLPQVVFAGLLRERLNGFALPDGQVAKLGTAGIPGLVGDPDLIFCGRDACVFVESKVAAHSKNHRYSFDQFTKYMTLAAIANCSMYQPFRRRSVHLILTPSLYPNQFCNDVTQWSPTVDGNRLVVDASRMRIKGTTKPFNDYESWANFMFSTLTGTDVNKRCPVDPTAVRTLFAERNPVIIPTYVMTYRDFLDDIRSRCLALDMPSHARAADVLKQLVYGEYQPMSDPD